MEKDPRKVKAGRKGAEARWGVPWSVRLDGLNEQQRRLVVALVGVLRDSNRAGGTDGDL